MGRWKTAPCRYRCAMDREDETARRTTVARDKSGGSIRAVIRSAPPLSPLAGLRRRRLSFTEVIAQSISAVAPSAASITIPAIVISHIGAAALFAFLLAAVVVTAVGYCVAQFATRMSSASGLYSFTSKALGPHAGFAAGWSLAIGYGAAAIASALATGIYAVSILTLAGVTTSISYSYVAVTVLLVTLVAAVLMARGIRLSSRISLTLEVVSIVLVVLVLVLMLTRPIHAPGAASGLHRPVGPSGLTLGVVLAITSFVGFESAGTLGAEAQRPFYFVPRALLWAPVALGVLYLFATSAQVVIFGSAPTATLASPMPVGELLQSRGDDALTYLLDIGIFASWFACLTGSANALARVLFSMGRENVLPRVFGRAHSTLGTPTGAIVVIMPIIAALPLLLSRDASLLSVLTTLLTVSALGYLVAYCLVAIATPALLSRIGELTRAPLIAGSSAAAIILVLVVWTMTTDAWNSRGATVTYLALMVSGAAWLAFVSIKDRSRLANVGVYDEPVQADLMPDAAEIGRT
jgi:amino acid transporter